LKSSHASCGFEQLGSLHLFVVIEDAPRRRPLELVANLAAIIELGYGFRLAELSADVLRRTLAAR